MGPLGFPELIIIFFIALIVFGPKKLPELGKSLGKGLREFKRATDDLKTNWEEQIRDAETSVKDVKQTLTDATSDLKKDLSSVVDMKELKDPLAADVTTAKEVKDVRDVKDIKDMAVNLEPEMDVDVRAKKSAIVTEEKK